MSHFTPPFVNNFFACNLFTDYSRPEKTESNSVLLFSESPVYVDVVLQTADFHYDLPEQLIAQTPSERRDASRLLVLNRSTRQIEHRQFLDFTSFLQKGDVLVVNDTRVLPARLRALKPNTGGAVEVLLLEEIGLNEWWAMLKPGKRVREGTLLEILSKEGVRMKATVRVQEKSLKGHYRLSFSGTVNIKNELASLGETPLPPYIRRAAGAQPIDQERYQTVFARESGSVAAPTAGLHFTDEVLERIRRRGIEIVPITLHVGLGTFAPVKATTLDQHEMHEEQYFVSEFSARTINDAKGSGRRVIAVGTTSLRMLESVAQSAGSMVAGNGRTKLFVHPPYEFQVVEVLLTNFHLPASTLLMLVSAFAAPGKLSGRDLIMEAYQEAIRERYRFFSYGDAMLII